MLLDKLLPVSNMASSRSEENVYLKHFQHHKVSQCWSALQYCLDTFVWIAWLMLLPMFVCYVVVLADVIVIDIFVADVMPTVLNLLNMSD